MLSGDTRMHRAYNCLGSAQLVEQQGKVHVSELALLSNMTGVTSNKLGQYRHCKVLWASVALNRRFCSVDQ